MQRLLLHGTKPSGILAITFTRKAAREIFGRLTEALRVLRHASSSTISKNLQMIGIKDPSTRIIEHARTLYERLLFSVPQPTITTFHAFCQTLLRIAPLHNSVPKGFEVLETCETQSLKNMALLKLYAFATQNPNHPVAVSFSHLLNLTQSLPSTKKMLLGFLEKANDWRSFTQLESEPVLWAKYYYRKAIEAFYKFPIEDLKPFLTTQQSHLIADYAQLLSKSSNQTHLNKAAKLIQLLNNTLHPDELYTSIKACFFTLSKQPTKLIISKSMHQKYGGLICQKLHDLHKQIGAFFAHIEDLRLAQQNLASSNAWVETCNWLVGKFQTLKTQKRVVDFDDLEWICEKLLQDDRMGTRDIQCRLNCRIRHILVDEFQDTNISQWNLLLRIFEELDTIDDGSIFIVGDRKQSIYGFRRAEVRLYQTATDWMRRHIPSKQLRYCDHLQSSYRASIPLVHFVNNVFAQKKNFPTPFDDFEPAKSACKTPGKVKFLGLFQKDREPHGSKQTLWRNPLHEKRTSMVSPHDKECETIADQILDLKRRKYPVVIQGETLDVDYSCIMILARRRTYFQNMARALSQRSIPFTFQTQTQDVLPLVISDTLALLDFLLSPHHDLSLAKVLRSPFLSVEHTFLTRLALKSQSMRCSWFSALEWLGRKKKRKWSHVAKQLTAWFDMAECLSVHDLLDQIFHITNYLGVARRNTYPERRAQISAWVGAVLLWALDFQHQHHPSIRSFRDYLQEHFPYLLAEPCCQVRYTNRVQILTVHAAKGLESPVIFLMDCNTSDPSMAYMPVTTNSLTKGRVSNFFPRFPKNKASSYAKHVCQTSKREAESLSLLYVALTRAKQYLFISGTQGRTKLQEIPIVENWLKLIQEGLDKSNTSDDGTSLQTVERNLLPQGSQLPEPERIAHSKIHAVLSPSQWRQIQHHHLKPANLREVSPSLLFPTKIKSQKEPVSTTTGPYCTKHTQAILEQGFQTTKTQRTFGTIVHRALALHGGPIHLNEAQIMKILTDEFGFFASMLQLAIKDAQDLIRAPKFRELFDTRAWQHIYTEVPIFYQDDEDNFVYGIIDRMCVCQDLVRIVDYKYSLKEAQTEASQHSDFLVAQHLAQLRAYAQGARKMYKGRKVHASIIYIPGGNMVE